MDQDLDLEAAKGRVFAKVSMAIAAGACFGSLLATTSNTSVLRYTMAIGANSGIAMTVFATLQEGVRALRGANDAWGSVLAGGLTGVALHGLNGARGRAALLVGAATWAPLCGVGHVAWDAVQPEERLRRVLLGAGLLDPPAVASQTGSARGPAVAAAASSTSAPAPSPSPLPASSTPPLPTSPLAAVVVTLDADSKALLESMEPHERIAAMKALQRRELAYLRKPLERIYGPDLAGVNPAQTPLQGLFSGRQAKADAQETACNSNAADEAGGQTQSSAAGWRRWLPFWR